MSSFAWLDHSERDRRKALDLIKLLGDRDTRDELGIGTVRDAFSDILFPGISTIETRARYFLFVPWIYLELEKKRGNSSGEEIVAAARRRELNLIEVLKSSTDSNGTIGILAGKNLKRLPSSIYWQGLGTWRIRLFGGSQAQYHRILERTRSSPSPIVRDDDNEPIRSSASVHWHPSVPSPPADWPREVSFSLLKREAAFLRERILMTARSTLLAFLIDHSLESAGEEFPWQHQHFDQFSVNLKEQLYHARGFSEVIHGAALLYNLMLAEKRRNSAWADGYRERLTKWSSTIASRHTWFKRWDRKRFWEIVVSGGATIPPRTRLFVERWLALALDAAAPEAIPGSSDARTLITERERSLKGNDGSRLYNVRALELWDGQSGTAQLNFRWTQASAIISDILNGLEGAY